MEMSSAFNMVLIMKAESSNVFFIKATVLLQERSLFLSLVL